MSLTWTPPGPGQWALDRSHTNRPATPLMQHLMVNSSPPGMRRVFRDLGVPADTLDMAFVNGMLYTRLRPLIRPDRPATKLPPLAVLKLVTRLHPEMRRRAKTADRVLAERPWRKVVADWEASGRDEVQRANLAFQDVDLAALSDLDLIDHAKRVVAHCIKNFELHFWLHGYDMGPIGLMLYEAQAWGLAPAEMIPLLEGASPSTSEPIVLLARLRAAVEASGRSPASLDELRSVSTEVATDLDAYLRLRGHLLFSRYDLDGVTLQEVPDMVLASVLAAEERDVAGRIAHQIAAARERVPAQHRDRFDEVVTEARAAMNLRDDNGPNTAEWPLGLLRMAMLEVGRRLVARGSATRVEHALEVRPEELKPTILAGKGPGADELARRAAVRASTDADQAPLMLGPAEAAPPLTVMPPSLARLVGTVQIVIAQMGMDGTRGSGLHGSGVGTRVHRGRARRADTPEEALERMEAGDVLVVPCTTPAYNVVLAVAGAVVTAEGGPLSHAAVLARELGIPAVVGAHRALREVPDGAEVEVDPLNGVVTVL